LRALAKLEAARPGGGKAVFLIADICGEAEQSHDANWVSSSSSSGGHTRGHARGRRFFLADEPGCGFVSLI